ncbi:MAG TPA: hypothetical protein VK459_23860 [Polyangiaceae bacterium]|nr:hypothetical protein [Polyangiaceae bacterium]
MTKLTIAFALPGSLLLIALSALGCGRSEEDIQTEWDETVAASSACQSAADCVLVSPGCPLGCFAAVNSAKKAEVEAKAAELIDAYESGGMACVYSCVAPGPLECVSGKCAVGASM